jgi:tryptophan-rich sensory protein
MYNECELECPCKCPPPTCRKVQCLETVSYEDDIHNKIITHRDDTSLQNDFMILTSGPVRENIDLAFQRIMRKETWFIYCTLIILYVMIFLSVWYGVNSTWYQSLIRTNYNDWVVVGLVAAAIILSYFSFGFLWNHITPSNLANETTTSIFFIIGALLTLLWSITLFQGQNLNVALWMGAVNFLYHFWLMIYVWYLNPKASIFMIPAVIMYGYLFYLVLHVATSNNITY